MRSLSCNRYRPTLEGLEDRCCPSTVSVSGSTLTITGDGTNGGNNTVTIRQDDATDTLRVSYDATLTIGYRLTGGRFDPFTGRWIPPRFVPITAPGTLSQNFTSSTISAINVSLGDFDDIVTYDLVSDLSHAKTLTINLGNQTNRANINLDANGAHSLHANLKIDVTGGIHRDELWVNQANLASARAVNIDAGDLLRLNLNGGGGVDDLRVDYRGVVSGHIDLRVLGGAGVDVGHVTGTALAGSFGSAYTSFDNVNEVPFEAVIESGSLLGIVPAPVQTAPLYSITVNRTGLTAADIEVLEETLRNLDPTGVGIGWLPSEFWYDSVSGATGYMGQGTNTFAPAGLALPPMVSNVSGGTTGVFVNGRQIVQTELNFLQGLLGPIAPGTYYLHNDGIAGIILPDGSESQPPYQWNLIQIAQAQGNPQRPGIFSTYDLTGISVLSDGNFLGILDADGRY
jgi:hypothetical protein